MRKDEAFPSNWLSKEQVMDGPLVVTIAKVEKQEVRGERGAEVLTVMSFREAVKPLILKPTNWGLVERLHGPESAEWVGRQIELFHDPNVMFGTDKVGGVRIRSPGSGPASAPETACVPPATSAPKAVEQMTFEDAKSAALEAGLNEDELKHRLKEKGVNSMTKGDDGPTVPASVVTAIIKEQNETIPFKPGPST